MTTRWVPALALAIYGLVFAGKALHGGLLVFDDHPGQLYRIWHVLTVGVWPWRFNTGWWAGYAELQFYPPGFSYAGAAVHLASLGALDLAASYRLLLWVTFLLPGAATYALLARVLKDPWLALPGGFLALTLSAGSRSGVEEGMRWGLVAARLGWGLLPLLALSLHRWPDRPRPVIAAALLAAIIVTHPAHAPAGVVLVLLAAWHAPGPGGEGRRRAALSLGLAGGLAAFWLLPLVAHLGMALPLAWGQPSPATLARSLLTHPLLLVLIAASALGWWMVTLPGSPPSAGAWLAGWAPAMAGVILLDAVVVQPLGLVWLPADRLLDSFFLASTAGASLALGAAARRLPTLPSWSVAVSSIGLCALLSGWYLAEPALSLWPRGWPNEWPKYETVARGVRVRELWEALGQAPPGRILFAHSAVPLEYRSGWRRPHSHITALTPIATGREILNGTFTHPSPIAGLLYTGSADNRPITTLVEERDGVTLFGRPLTELDASRFNELAGQLRVSAVVALDEDQGRLDFVARNPVFAPAARIGPFVLFLSRVPRPLPSADGPQRWRLPAPDGGGWLPTGMAYSPLWRCRAGGQRLPTRRGELGLLEVNVPPGGGTPIELEHRAGAIEWSGLAVSAASLLALLALSARRRSYG
ncbi:MAG TPA: hypothetical protein VGT40_25435 [Methylomirabilota bacterium]|nr:hypothetical protein [Methylomirabilota bacterium]